MGDYIVSADLKARFEDDAAVAHLTDTGDTGVPDEDVITEVIGSAEGLMNSYFARLYAVPIDTTDTDTASMLKGMALDIAEFLLLKRGDLVSEEKKDQFAAVKEWLRDVSKGVAKIAGATAPTATTVRGPYVEYNSDDERTFSRSNQSGL